MARPLTTAMVTEVKKDLVRPFFLVDLDFPSGNVRLTDRSRDVTFNGDTYLGDGTLLNLGDILETADVRATGQVIQLVGTSGLKTKVRDDFFAGRRAAVWLGMTDGADATVLAPEPMYSGIMEAASIDDDPVTGVMISLSLESRLRDLNVVRERRWTDRDQRIEFPNDGGFRYVEAIQDFTLRAGRV